MKRGAHRILLVDDDFDERFLSDRILQKIIPEPGSIHQATCGNEAIAYMIGEGKFADRKTYPFPTLVITDLNMEDGDGFDVLEFMQHNPAWSVVPRIVFSSSDDDDDVRTAYALGASVYHLKPSPPRELERQFRLIIEYWTTSQVPPVDENGRLLVTQSIGRRGARYPQRSGGRAMKRP